MFETNEKNETSMSVVAQPVTVSAVSRGPREKIGHKCCGCCCDVRRAVVAVNVIMVVFESLALIIFADARNVDVEEDAQEDFPWTALMIISGVSLLASCVGVYGALTYNNYALAFTAVVYVASIVINIMGMNYVGIIPPILFLYPHLVLIQEIHAGVMSEENYKNQEEHSCCCVQV
jgi:hypothetical protein